jgi:hypothetical protein
MQTVNRRTLSLIPVVALVLPFAGACISGAPAVRQHRADPLATEFGQPRGQAFVSQGDLIQTRESNLFDALMRLRPNQMRPAAPNVGGADTSVIVAYLDDNLLGEVQQLRAIRTGEVISVRFLSKVETSIKFGRSPVGGSVVVRTR